MLLHKWTCVKIEKATKKITELIEYIVLYILDIIVLKIKFYQLFPMLNVKFFGHIFKPFD
jgi:hypothetical protein